MTVINFLNNLPSFDLPHCMCEVRLYLLLKKSRELRFLGSWLLELSEDRDDVIVDW
jgi:hypothetical protein